jgi:hypothetical protein
MQQIKDKDTEVSALEYGRLLSLQADIRNISVFETMTKNLQG